MPRGGKSGCPNWPSKPVRLEVDIIVASTKGSAKAAKGMTPPWTIPIVMAAAGDPVGLGLAGELLPRGPQAMCTGLA